MELNGRVALVTGGGTGLGRAISLAFAAAGADVVVNYSRSEAEARQTAEEVAALGRRGVPIRADVGQSEQVKRLVAETLSTFGRLDVLVCNAASTVYVPMADLEGVSEEDWDRIMALNVKAPWLCARAAAAALREARGAIVTISSISALRPSGSSMPYVVSKAALVHLTHCLAVALAPEVRVNSVAPGLMLTRWSAGLAEPYKRAAIDSSLLKKDTSVDDVAKAVIALATNDTITGQTLAVDAGIVFH